MNNLTENPDNAAEGGAISAPVKFHVDFLADYTDEALLEELRRVAALIPLNQPLTMIAYEAHLAKASVSVLKRRFGGWRQALDRGGLGDRYSGRRVSEKMKSQPAKALSSDDLVEETRRVRDIVGNDWLTDEDFDMHSISSAKVIRLRFGSFANGLRSAGISQSPMARQQASESECFKNLAEVWTHYARAPLYREMSIDPSRIKGASYQTRWGTWRKALLAFSSWANEESSETVSQERIVAVEQTPSTERIIAKIRAEDRHEVKPALRFKVLRRDGFRCVACGRSPATHLNVELHADHILAFVNGGKTTFENLQTLCQDCNLGKGRML